jgi:hypothetical protein
MFDIRLLGSLLTLCLSLSYLAAYGNPEVQLSIDTLDTLNASQDEELISEGFEPPNDDERQPSRTVG